MCARRTEWRDSSAERSAAFAPRIPGSSEGRGPSRRPTRVLDFPSHCLEDSDSHPEKRKILVLETAQPPSQGCARKSCSPPRPSSSSCRRNRATATSGPGQSRPEERSQTTLLAPGAVRGPHRPQTSARPESRSSPPAGSEIQGTPSLKPPPGTNSTNSLAFSSSQRCSSARR